MTLTFFCIPVLTPEPQSQALNQFLRENPKAHVDRQLIADGQQSVWAVCCTLPNTAAAVVSSENTASLHSQPESSRKRIDYRDVLEPDHFARYAVLRNLRNGMASEKKIPAYSIFSNAQLAEMVQLDQLDRKTIAGIEGIGEKRIALYADAFIQALEAL